MMAVTKQPHDGRQSVREHWEQYHEGSGTLFQDSEDKARIAGAKTQGPHVLHSVQTLDESEQLEVLQKFGVGSYQPLKEPTMEDPLGSIEIYTTRNETYLPRDGEMLKAQVQELLPVSKPRSASAKQATR